jgi:hypothetical protein
MLHLRPSCSLTLLLSVPLLVACGYGDHQRDGNGNANYGPGPTSQATIEQATIDTDALVGVDAGDGAGVFIEYQAGGTYRVRTNCNVDQGVCYWDILVTPLDDAPVLGVGPVDLESDDSVSVFSGNQARLVAYTDNDFDGFTLQTEPGAAIELDALLDNGAANRRLFWFGDGALHSGAPSNPVDLVPSAQ